VLGVLLLSAAAPYRLRREGKGEEGFAVVRAWRLYCVSTLRETSEDAPLCREAAVDTGTDTNKDMSHSRASRVVPLSTWRSAMREPSALCQASLQPLFGVARIVGDSHNSPTCCVVASIVKHKILRQIRHRAFVSKGTYVHVPVSVWT
jgi:hypothetical protein